MNTTVMKTIVQLPIWRFLPPTVFALTIVAFSYLIWTNEYLPFEAFHSGVLYSNILFELWQDSSPAKTFYAVTAGAFPPPGSLTTVILAGLQYLLPAEAAGRLLLVIYTIAFSLTYYFFCTRVSSRNPFRFMGPVFALGYTFYLGHINILLGLALLLALFLWLDRPRLSIQTRAVGLFLFTLLLFAIDGFSFILGILGILAWAIRRKWEAERSLALLAYVSAILPALTLLMFYLIDFSIMLAEAAIPYGAFGDKLQVIGTGLAPFSRLALLEPPLPLTLTNIIVMLTCLGLYLYNYSAISWRSGHALFAFLAALLLLFFPYQKVGALIGFTPAMLMIIFLIPGGLVLFLQSGRLQEMIITGLLLLSIFMHWQTLRGYDLEISTSLTDVAFAYHESDSPLILNYLYHEDTFAQQENIFGGVVQTFGQSLAWINDSISHPVKLAPGWIVENRPLDIKRRSADFRALFSTVDTRNEVVELARDNMGPLCAQHDRLLIFGKDEGRNELASALAPAYEVGGRYKWWTLLVRREYPY